ncbi:flavin reductase [Micromonospora sp. NBRC 101691]|uniref:flavin reductase n=1 Tax=Micromonospora sp. NBRC 101691 TaxID=3032198 RepID=UPI0025571769|nr:flavin reductase [Micromonospora sp. NBRC 101691]
MTPYRPRRDHIAVRPSWRCRVCGAPWPCQPAKLQLLDLYADDRLGLMVDLGMAMAAALPDLPRDENQLDRFVRWARPPRRRVD